MIYVATAWESGWCVWEELYEAKPTREQVVEDLLRDGLRHDDYDYISIDKEGTLR